MFALRPLPAHARAWLHAPHVAGSARALMTLWEGVDDVVLEALVALGDAARF